MRSFNVFLDSAYRQCESNMLNSSIIHNYLIENGHKITQNAQTADFIIIVTCGFNKICRDTSIAKYKKYHAIKKPDTKIIMFGCMVKIDEAKLQSLDALPISFEDGPLMDKLFFQKKKFEEMAPYCDGKTINNIFLKQKKTALNSIFLLSKLFLPFSRKIKENYNNILFSSNYNNKIFVQISRGCLSNCSYCIIKKAKSNLKSRNIDAIIADIERLYGPSKTLLLVGDDCSCYGLDSGTNLFKLTKIIHERFPDLKIQLNYISPNFLVRFHNEFRELFKEVLVPYTCISIQSGSNKIIKSMNRHDDVKQILEIIKELRQLSPKTYIEGDFIIGFPGETTIDFLKSLATIKYFDIPIPYSYSEAEGMKSTMFPHKKSDITKNLRFYLMTFFINFLVLYKLLTHPSK